MAAVPGRGRPGPIPWRVRPGVREPVRIQTKENPVLKPAPALAATLAAVGAAVSIAPPRRPGRPRCPHVSGTCSHNSAAAEARPPGLRIEVSSRSTRIATASRGRSARRNGASSPDDRRHAQLAERLLPSIACSGTSGRSQSQRARGRCTAAQRSDKLIRRNRLLKPVARGAAS
jgi:hypothetical protein